MLNRKSPSLYGRFQGQNITVLLKSFYSIYKIYALPSTKLLATFFVFAPKKFKIPFTIRRKIGRFERVFSELFTKNLYFNLKKSLHYTQISKAKYNHIGTKIHNSFTPIRSKNAPHLKPRKSKNTSPFGQKNKPCQVFSNKVINDLFGFYYKLLVI